MIDEPNFADLESDVREARYTALVLKTVLDNAIDHPLKGPFGTNNETQPLTRAENDLLAFARAGFKVLVLTADQWECLDYMACENINKITELSEKYHACLEGKERDAPSKGADVVKFN